MEENSERYFEVDLHKLFGIKKIYKYASYLHDNFDINFKLYWKPYSNLNIDVGDIFYKSSYLWLCEDKHRKGLPKSLAEKNVFYQVTGVRAGTIVKLRRIKSMVAEQIEQAKNSCLQYKFRVVPIPDDFYEKSEEFEVKAWRYREFPTYERGFALRDKGTTARFYNSHMFHWCEYYKTRIEWNIWFYDPLYYPYHNGLELINCE